MSAILFVTTEIPSSYALALRQHGYRVTEVESAEQVRSAVGKENYGLVIFEVPAELELFRYHYSFIASMLPHTQRILLLDCRQRKMLDQSHPIFDTPIASFQLIQKPIARFDFVDRVHSVCGCRATNVNRIAVAIDIEAFDGKRRYEGVIRNISSSGVRMSIPRREDIRKGDILHVRFAMAMKDSDYCRAISAMTEVVWCLDTTERRGLWPWRRPHSFSLGLQFSQMSYEDKNEIKTFVEQAVTPELVNRGSTGVKDGASDGANDGASERAS